MTEIACSPADRAGARRVMRTPAAKRRPPAGAADACLEATFAAPLAPGESAAAGFARKERELGAIFASLPPAEARAYHARFASPQPDDAIAMRFAGLVAERRARLLAFLADARRRACLAASR